MDALAKLSAATYALAEAKTLDDVKRIIDIAEAARTYAKAAKLGLEAANHAAEVKLRAERKAGELLQQLERAPGPGRGNTEEKIFQAGKSFPESEYRAVLTDSDIAPTTAHRWQSLDPTKGHLCRAIRLINSVIRLNVKHLLQNCDKLIDWQGWTLVGRYGILFL